MNANPTPKIAANGTTLPSTPPSAIMKSSAPERIWASICDAPPSWLLGKSRISSFPPLSLRISAKIWFARTLVGLSAALSVPILSENCGAADARRGTIAIDAKPAAAVATKRRRDTPDAVMWDALLSIRGSSQSMWDPPLMSRTSPVM
nr:hypothetical protein [Vulcanimicrobium alpinum]